MRQPVGQTVQAEVPHSLAWPAGHSSSAKHAWGELPNRSGLIGGCGAAVEGPAKAADLGSCNTQVAGPAAAG